MLLPQSALPPLSTLQVLLLMLHLTTTLRVAVLAIAFVSTCPELHVPAALAHCDHIALAPSRKGREMS